METQPLIKGKLYRLPVYIAYEHKGSPPPAVSPGPWIGSAQTNGGFLDLDPWSTGNYRKSETDKYEALCRYGTVKNETAVLRWLNPNNPSGIFLGNLIELCEKETPWTNGIVVHRPLKKLPPGSWGNYEIPVFLHEADVIFPFSFSTRTIPKDPAYQPDLKKIYIQNVGPFPHHRDFINATTIMKLELENICP